MKVNSIQRFPARSKIWLFGFLIFMVISLIWIAGAANSPVKADILPPCLQDFMSPDDVNGNNIGIYDTNCNPAPDCFDCVPTGPDLPVDVVPAPGDSPSLPVECQNLEPEPSALDPIASWTFGFNADQPDLIKNNKESGEYVVVACAQFFSGNTLKGFTTVECPIKGDFAISNGGLLLAKEARFDCHVNLPAMLADLKLTSDKGDELWLPEEINYAQVFIKGHYESPSPEANGENQIIGYDGSKISIKAGMGVISTGLIDSDLHPGRTKFSPTVVSHAFLANINTQWRKAVHYCLLTAYSCTPYNGVGGESISVYTEKAVRLFELTHNDGLLDSQINDLSYGPFNCSTTRNYYSYVGCYPGTVYYASNSDSALEKYGMPFILGDNIFTFGGGKYPIVLHTIVFDPGARSGPSQMK